MNFIFNTDSLAKGKEDAMQEYPARNKAPLYFYKNGETKERLAYFTLKEESSFITGEFFGLQTPADLRGINLKIQLGAAESKFLRIRTNLDTSVSLMLMKKIWPGGPYSLLYAMILLDEKVSKKPWLRQYIESGEIGALPEKTMGWVRFFLVYGKLFN